MAGLLSRATLFSTRAPTLQSLKPPARPRSCSHAAVAAPTATTPARKLVLYSKKGCCLCDALKDKLHTAFMIGGHDSLVDVQLEVRDITTNPDWEKAYQYEIPVLARLLADGSQETLPRFSPRVTPEQLQKKLAVLLS